MEKWFKKLKKNKNVILCKMINCDYLKRKFKLISKLIRRRLYGKNDQKMK